MASQPKKRKPFRLWLWNRPSGQASSHKQPKTQPKPPPQKSLEAEQELQSQRTPRRILLPSPSPSPPSSPSPASSPSRRVSSSKASTTAPKPPPQKSLEAEQELQSQSAPQSIILHSPPHSPPPSPRRSADEVPQRQQQQPSPRESPPLSSQASPSSSKEDPTTSTDSPALSQDVAQPQPTQGVSQTQLPFLQTEMPEKTIEPNSSTDQQEISSQISLPSQAPKQLEPNSTSIDTGTQTPQAIQDLKPTQGVSQTQLPLQTEMPKKTIEPKSQNDQQEIRSQISLPSQAPKQLEPSSTSIDTGTQTPQATQDLEPKAEILVPTDRTPKDTPLSERETTLVQEKNVGHQDSVANTHPSQLPEIQESQIQSKKSVTDLTTNQQTLVEERPKQGNEETTTKSLDVTKDTSPRSQESEVDEIKKEQPKVDPEPQDNPTEERKDKTELNKFNAEPDSRLMQVLPEKKDSSNEENKVLREKENPTLVPDVPQGSPILGDNFQIGNLVRKLNIRHSQRAAHENGIRVITLAGENNGASMHIGRKTLNDTGFQRGHKIDEHTNVESLGKNKALTERYSKINEIPPIRTSINSNVQSINNSLLHDSSCSQEDPGVHLTLSSEPTQLVDSRDEIRPFQHLKSAFNTTTSQTLSYQPNIKKGQ